MSDKLNFNLHSLPKEQAKTLTEITKTRPQMEGISSRNLIKHLPWVNVQGGYYRVNRRQILEIRPGIVTFQPSAAVPTILSESLSQMPSLRKITDKALLEKIANAAENVEFARDAQILTQGTEPSQIYIIYSGKVSFYQSGVFDESNITGSMSTGQYFGGFGLHYDAELPEGDAEDIIIPEPPYMHHWQYSARAATKVVMLSLEYRKVMDIITQHIGGAGHLGEFLLSRKEVMGLADKSNRKGEHAVQLFAGLHDKEPNIPSTYVAYDPNPKEYELSSVQTILKIHTKIADLYNYPYNQTEEQVRLSVEELKEAEEYQLINNVDFGLLNVADYRQRIQTQSGAPTPDDMDELLSRRRKTQYIFAPSKAIAAFTRECTKRGIYPSTVEINGRETIAWRGVPIFTCNKIPIVDGVTSIIAMRTGVEDQGVVGLYQMGLPDEIEASMSVRFMGIDEKAIISYLITNYFSVAVLVPDALGVLENVEVGIY